MTAPTTTLWKIGTASAEGSEYEGEYRGTCVRFVRTTDPNDDGPYYGKAATETRWDGYVRDGNGWSAVAECYGRRIDAVARVERYVDDVIAGKYER